MWKKFYSQNMQSKAWLVWDRIAEVLNATIDCHSLMYAGSLSYTCIAEVPASGVHICFCIRQQVIPWKPLCNSLHSPAEFHPYPCGLCWAVFHHPVNSVWMNSRHKNIFKQSSILKALPVPAWKSLFTLLKSWRKSIKKCKKCLLLGSEYIWSRISAL